MTKTNANAKTETSAAKKPAVRIKFFVTKDGKRNQQVLRTIVRLRDNNLLSWVKIGEAVGCTPRMANRLYDEKAGIEGAHHGLLPGKGGRLPELNHCAKCQNPNFNAELEGAEEVA